MPTRPLFETLKRAGPSAPDPFPKYIKINQLTTLRKPTSPTHQTPPFVFHGAAAVGAGGHGCGFRGGVYLGHAAQHPGDGVGAGEDLVAVLPDGAGAADAGDLFDDGLDFHPGAQGEGDEAAGGLDLAGGAAPGLPHLGEDLAEPQLVRVHRDVELAATGVDKFGNPGGAGRPGPGGDVLGFLGFGLLFAKAQHLLVPAAVPVDGHALKAHFIGHEVHLSDVFRRGLAGEVHRLGDRVVGVFLEGRLDADVPLGGGFVGGDEEAAEILGNFLDVPDGARLGDVAHEFRGVKAPAPGQLFE